MAFNRIEEYDAVTAANNIDIGGSNVAEGCPPSGINNALRELARQIRVAVANQGANIASAGTTDIGAATGQYVKVTGTTTITAFGTVNAGAIRWVEFTGILTLTHNATSLKLPGAANITTADGDVACMVSLGSGNWKCLAYDKADGKPVISSTIGKHKIWIPAADIRPAVSNPCASLASNETVTNLVNYASLDFDQTLAETASFNIGMPSSWDEGTVTARFVWTAASGAGDVRWTLEGRAFSDDDALDQAFGTGVESLDTLITAGDVHRSPETSAMTIAGTPAANDLVVFRVVRSAANVADTLTADAKLIGVELYMTTSGSVDVS